MTDETTNSNAFPVLDEVYLDDMREWVGDETLSTLLAGAPSAIEDQSAAVRNAWAAGDLNGVKESGHRLKGAAGSVACPKLSEAAHRVQLVTGLDQMQLLEELAAEVGNALAALDRYRLKLLP